MRLRFVSVPAAVALLCAAGCSVITSFDGFSGGSGDTDATVKDAGTGEAGVDAASGPTTEETLCSPRIPSPPGETPESMINANAGVVTAFRFNPLDGGCPQLGKNLDGIDSCDAGAACITSYNPASSCLGDYAGGVDNAGQVALGTLLFSDTGALSNLPNDIAAQRTGFVLSLNNYGGELNNSSVNVGFLSDVGIGADGGTIVDQASVTGSGFHVVTQTQGYVTNGVLVAHFTTVPMHFTTLLPDASAYPGMHGALLNVTDAYIIGHPVLGDGGLTMTDAQLVGRITAPDLVSALTAVYACVNAGNAPVFCPLLDLPASPQDDTTGLGYCEAISFAVGFDLAPTTIAGTAPATLPVDLCTTDEPVPITDTVCVPAAPDSGRTTPTDGGDGGDDDGP
jgi:hypothetical protein